MRASVLGLGVMAGALTLASCALLRAPGSEVPARSVLVLSDEQQEGPRGQTVPQGLGPPELARVVTEQLVADGWTVRIPPTGPLPPGPMEARQLGLAQKAAVVVLVKARFSRHEGMVGTDGQPITFPVTGLYELTMLGTQDGNILGTRSGKLTVARPGDHEGDAMGKMLVSYDRTLHDMLERRKADTIAPSMREALEKYLAGLGDAGVP